MHWLEVMSTPLLISVPLSEESDKALIEKKHSKIMLSEDDQEGMHPILRSLYQTI